MSKAKRDKVPIDSVNESEARSRQFEWLFGYGENKNKDRFLQKLLKKNWSKVLSSTLLYLLQSSPVFIIPLITADIIDVIASGNPNYMTHILVGIVLAVVLLAQNIPTAMWRQRILNNWIRSTTAEIKSGVVRKLQRLAITYHKEIEEGRIQSKLLRDIENVEGYYRGFLHSFLPCLVNAIISAVIALVKSPVIALFFVVAIPLNLLCTTAFRKRIGKDNRAYREENEKLSARLTTALQMLQLSKAHGLLSKEEHDVDERILNAKSAGLKLDKTNSVFGSVMWVVSQAISLLSFFFCVALAINGIVTVGDVVLYQSLFASISGSILSLINIYPSLMVGKDAVHSLSEIICAEDIERDNGKMPVPGIEGEVEFDSVTYSFPGEDKKVIKSFSLKVKKGERIAVVGGSGSGKSTVMNLLIGLLSPTEGRVLIDGVPLTDIPLQSYRKFISVVPQNSILFSGTIRENITYGLSRYSEDELLRAVEDADINEFLPSLPHGLDSQVGEHGDKLSGGQRQRVSIARALIRNPKILIMDEATSALDNVAEFHVQRAIDRLVEGRTTFTVAHRLSTIRNADRIVVMEEGEIVEVGTYDELMNMHGKFAELERLSRIRESEVESA